MTAIGALPTSAASRLSDCSSCRERAFGFGIANDADAPMAAVRNATMKIVEKAAAMVPESPIRSLAPTTIRQPANRSLGPKEQ